MNTLDAILTRRSCREFTDKPVRSETLHQLLEAAMSGPSCVNARDWSFVVVTDPEKLAQMADANGRPAEPLRTAAGVSIIIPSSTSLYGIFSSSVHSISVRTSRWIISDSTKKIIRQWVTVRSVSALTAARYSRHSFVHCIGQAITEPSPSCSR